MSPHAAELDLHALVAAAKAPDIAASDRVRALADTMASGGGPGAAATEALARLALWSSPGRPILQRPILCLYASSYGWRSETAATRARLEALAQGEGAANAFARAQGAGVEAFDLALDRPSPDAALGEVMSLREAAATVAFGMEALAKAPDLLLLSSVSDGEAEAGEALAATLDLPVQASSAWSRAVADRVKRAVADTPIELLRQACGRDVAALTGAILAARSQGVPVLLEGPAALTAAHVARLIHPSALDHLVGAVERSSSCATLRQALDLPEPLARLGRDAGQGVGALAALSVLRLAAELFDL